MSQVDYAIPSSSYVQASRDEFITFFEALLTKNSGATEPTVKFAFMFWVDTSTGLIKQRNAANTDWIIWGYYANQGFLRTNAGDPNGALTGNYEGEECYDTTNDRVYKYSGGTTVWYRQAKFNEAVPFATKTATPYTVLTTDNILEWNGSANGTFNLYASSGNAGKILQIRNITSLYTLTLDGNASETIDGLTTIVIYPSQTITLYCDGTNWKSIKEQGKGRVLIEEKTASSSATIEFTRGLDGSFSKYEIELVGIVPATTDTILMMRTSSNGGSSYDSGASNYQFTNLTSSHSSTALIGGLSTQIELCNSTAGRKQDNSTGQGVSGLIEVREISQTARVKRFNFELTYRNTGSGIEHARGSGNRDSTSIINGIQFLESSGNIASGTFRLYGVN